MTGRKQGTRKLRELEGLSARGRMRWMMYVVGLHSLMLMIEKGERRQVAATVICVLCGLCVLCRSQGSMDFYGVGGVQRYLESKGIALVDVGIALIFYEVTGMLVLLLFWAACFASQPIKHGILAPLQTVFSALREVVGVAARPESCARRATDRRVCIVIDKSVPPVFLEPADIRKRDRISLIAWRPRVPRS